MQMPSPEESNLLLDSLVPMAALMDALPESILVVNGDGLVLHANQTSIRLFGGELPSLIGKPVDSLVQRINAAEIGESSGEPRFRDGDKPHQNSSAFLGNKKDGSQFPIIVDRSEIELPSGKGALFIIRDHIEDRPLDKDLLALNADLERRMEVRTQELRASEARYSALFHSTDEGFCIIEMIFDSEEKPIDYRFLEINPAFERQTGITNAVGKRMREIAPNHEEHWFEIYGQIAITGEPSRFQNHAEQLNRFYDVYACRIGDPNDRQVAILFNDITEKRNMESALVEAKDRAEKANLAKSEFLSRMSHELRTPMNSILGYAQLLDMYYEDNRIKEAAHLIIKGGNHLLAMINEVLDLSRIESGNLSISIEPILFKSVLSQAMSLIQPIADRAGISLTVQSDVCESMHVEADQQRFLQVMINLLNNGVKYNRPGGRVVVQCFEPVDGLSRIEISDTGLGIDKRFQESIFQPFQRFGDPSVEGTGLGLALSERFVNLMGGTLCLVESSPNGTTFRIEMKAATASKRDPEPSRARIGESDSMTKRSGAVLYIEDNLSNMRLLEDVFEAWSNITLIPAVQGTIGLELAFLHQPNLILLDVHLPDMMGDKVLERLKSDPATNSIPVVVVSADATDKQINTLLASGAVEYLTKPLDLRKLIQVLSEHLPLVD